MWHLERRDGDVAVAIHHAGAYIFGDDSVSSCVRRFAAVETDVHVLRIGLHEKVDHPPGARWAEHIERSRALQYPGREHEVRQPDRVVGVQMREKHAPQPGCGQRRNTVGARGQRSAAYNTGARVYEIRLAIHHDRHRGA
jgi:hypothetical protein